MLKSLNKNDTLHTPFTTTKDWHLSNNENNDLILFEHTASDGSDITVAVEFIDYGDGSTLQPFVNSSCSLANEHQSIDLATYSEGKKIRGLFFPDTDPQNLDQTYKRLVYTQIQNMFYNNYRDPSKIWGMEELDFEKSQAKKFLTDKFVVFTVLPNIMGEKILPTSVEFIDNSSDNEYSITDDGNTNLFIGRNVFSKQQELSSFGNNFQTGSDGTCNSYFHLLTSAPVLTGTSIGMTGSFLTWITSSTDTGILGFGLERSSTYTMFSSLQFFSSIDDVFDSITDQSSVFSLLQLFSSTTQSYVDVPPLVPNVPFYYRVYSFTANGSSPYSNIVSVQLDLDALVDSSGSLYTGGPYDTFESYDTGSTPSNKGFGWAAPWDIRSIGAPDFSLVVAIDPMDDYSGSVGGSIIGLNSGSGWAAPWTGSM